MKRTTMRWQKTHKGIAGCERGFTMIELLVTLVIIGILVSIALPTYLGAQTRAADKTAKSNIRQVIPIVEAFAADNVGTRGDADGKARTSGYKGMTIALLRANYDAGIAPTLTVVSGKTTTTGYCLTDTQRGRSWSIAGPGFSAAAFRNNARCR